MDKFAANRLTLVALPMLLLVAFAFGGGGSRFGLANLTVQLSAIAVLALHQRSLVQFLNESPWHLRWLVTAAVILPIIQLVPLPPTLWTAVPGRDLAARSQDIAGGIGWMPLSLNPLRTLLALTALITPLAVLVIGWSQPRHRLVFVGWIVVGLGIATTLLGVTQLGATGQQGTLFGARNPGAILLGTFANRNSTGLFLGFALALAALLPAPRPHPALVFGRIAVCIVLLLAIVLTRSRTALALAMLPLAIGGMKAVWWNLRDRGIATTPHKLAGRPLTLILGAFSLIAACTTTLIIVAPEPISQTLERFEAKDDPRRFIWDDASYTAGRYWPVGAGVGSFDDVFQVDESLENLTKRTAGRAHNDYLELAIETGLAGLVLAALWLVMIGWMSWRARLSSQRWTAWAGSSFLISIALQSITDYPLRNQAILAFSGFALLLLARAASNHSRQQP